MQAFTPSKNNVFTKFATDNAPAPEEGDMDMPSENIDARWEEMTADLSSDELRQLVDYAENKLVTLDGGAETGMGHDMADMAEDEVMEEQQ